MKAIIGTVETITLDEAHEMLVEQTDSLVGYLYPIAEKATDDEDQLSNVMVNLTAMVGKVIAAAEMQGVLEDPDVYLQKTFGRFAETVKIGDVDEETEEA